VHITDAKLNWPGSVPPGCHDCMSHCQLHYHHGGDVVVVFLIKSCWM